MHDGWSWLHLSWPWIGLSYWGVIAVNGVVHLVPVVRGDGYAPGLLTALLLFLPLAAWTAYAAFLRGPLPRVGDAALFGLQVVNAALPLVVCGLAATRLRERPV